MKHAALYAVVLACLSAVPAVSQNIAENILASSYIVTGATLAEVEADMNANGPKDEWGALSWRVSWTESCEITISGGLIMPRLSETAPLSSADIKTFKAMLAALEEHQLGHMAFARGYAADVAAVGCKADQALLDAWQQKERDYDAETARGREQGVHF